MEDRKILLVSYCHFGGEIVINQHDLFSEVFADLPISEFNDAISADYADRLLGDYPIPEYCLVAEDHKKMAPMFIPVDRHNGGPRSIRETMRQNRRSKCKGR